MIADRKTMLTIFLSIHDAIFIDWLPLGEKFNSGCFPEEYPNRFPKSCTALNARSPRPIVDLTMPHLISQSSLKNVFRVANSDTLSNLPMALTSVSVTSFYSVI
jgi:hypothetical protein